MRSLPLMLIAALGAAVGAPTDIPHPRVKDTTSFPASQVPDSRLAIIIATEAYLGALDTPIAVGPPIPSEALADLGTFAKKGEKLWEVAIYATDHGTRTQVGLINVNANTASAAVLCLEPKRPCDKVGR